MDNCSNLSIVILAGGLGKRMRSEIPKVLHLLCGKPMLVHVLETAFHLNPAKIYLVVGKYRMIIEETLSKFISLNNIVFVDQPDAQGTGHAVHCVRPHLLDIDENHKIVILSGDVPLLKSNTICSLNTEDKVCLMSTQYQDPTGYGRIVQDNNGQFSKIVEQKDCDEEEVKIDIVNAGVYMFTSGLLCDYLPMINNHNAQSEYYLTDIFEIIKTQENIPIGIVHLPCDKSIELTGINTKEQLEILESQLLSEI